MAEYIELSAQEKSVLTKQEEEKQYWFDWLKQLRTTKEYPIKETAVDNFLRGYGEAVQYMLSVNEQLLLKSADVVEVVHGHNETSMHPVDEFLCSVCGFCCVDYTETKYNEDGDYEYSCECEFDYCPKCGAKMDEKKGD
ncbi:MAG: hypothetical protein IJA34_00855 [Lachnospiraceae bacterium]|nr:hypothetical protein [Lachnospiraceae bacterium]